MKIICPNKNCGNIVNVNEIPVIHDNIYLCQLLLSGSYGAKQNLMDGCDKKETKELIRRAKPLLSGYKLKLDRPIGRADVIIFCSSCMCEIYFNSKTEEVIEITDIDIIRKLAKKDHEA